MDEIQQQCKEKLFHGIEADGHCTLYTLLLICPYLVEQAIATNTIYKNKRWIAYATRKTLLNIWKALEKQTQQYIQTKIGHLRR